MFIVDAKVMTVGLGEKSEALRELRIRLFVMCTGIEAVRCLREEKIDAVISRWDLSDMGEGEFLGRVREAKPGIPTIAFVSPGDQEQEAAARSLGVSVVLEENTDDDCFRRVLCQLLGIGEVRSIRPTGSYNIEIDTSGKT